MAPSRMAAAGIHNRHWLYLYCCLNCYSVVHVTPALVVVETVVVVAGPGPVAVAGVFFWL